MQIKRTALVVLAIAAATAPSAQARVLADSPAPATAQTRVEVTPTDGSRYADIASHREQIANRHWEQAGNVPVFSLTRPVSDGFDWRSAIAGGLSALMLVLLFTLFLRPTLRPRRVSVA